MASPLILEDYYSILRVPQSAPLEIIRESYKKLALRYHPDKNKSPNATTEFQCLGRAWEVLKDEGKRREYDANYWVVKIGLGVGVNVGSAAGASSSGGYGEGGGKRKWEWDWEDRKCDEEAADEAERARRRREDVDRDASERFRSEGSENGKNEAKEKAAKANEERRGKARAWKVMARQDYALRFAAWDGNRTGSMISILRCQQEIKKHEVDLEKQMRETDQEITKRFYEAAERSRAAGAVVKDEHLILKKLLEGRRAYAAKLEQAIEAARTRREGIITNMQRNWKKYETEEAKARQDRIREALGILGPRDLKSPLFSMIDRRGQAINIWKALSRVKAAVDIPSPIAHGAEGPWHVEGTWKRVVGEQTCGRCQQTSFQLIAECAAAECPGCGMIACNACCRDLMLLREYSEWLSCRGKEMQDSLFELEFDSCDKAREFGDTSGFNYFGFANFSHI
jgi:curved DNA-binding protein CbpA